MRTALISDLHGNHVSLKAVLDDIDRTGIDEVICLGDVATLGPRPSEVISELGERGCRCILGNHDAFMLDDQLIRSYTEVPIVVDAVDWCRDQLSADEIAFLSRFELKIPMQLGKNTSALLFHGSPRSHMEDLLATTPPDELDEALAGSQATVLAGGHTHIQMLRQHRGMLLVNPGSVGMPFRQYASGNAPQILPHAEYAVIEADDDNVSVTLRRVSVDKHRLRAEAADSDNPICRSLEQQYT
ncbi:MAG TPA: metallophosphoesterase family protein [Candidatus Limnocylindrales bacterium]|nr:metallophosphoesterase family protein [Candidatus Limnocylindrales bacterium]